MKDEKLNINCDLNDMCAACPNLETTTDVENIYAGYKLIVRIINLSCKNKHICESIKQYLKEDEETKKNT